jgi:hypothetical protein
MFKWLKKRLAPTSYYGNREDRYRMQHKNWLYNTPIITPQSGTTLWSAHTAAGLESRSIEVVSYAPGLSESLDQGTQGSLDRDQTGPSKE